MIIQQVDYVLDELHGYAALRDEETRIEVRACDMPWCVTSNRNPGRIIRANMEIRWSNSQRPSGAAQNRRCSS